MFIHGKQRDRPETFDIRNPYSGATVGTVSMDRPEDAEAALRSLTGPRTPLRAAERTALLQRAADAVARRREDFARSITGEAGIALKESRKEVDRAVTNLRVAAEEAGRIHGEALRVGAGNGERLALTLHEPVGVVFAITPFNRPLNQVVVKIAPALAADNAILLKPSEKTPLTALAFADLLVREAGLPPDRLAVLTGDPIELGETLLDHPGIDLITFTGGVATGERIAAGAGLKRLAMELGGNDPLIVLADGDLEAAVRVAVPGAFATAGQSCRGVKRILVAEEVAERFATLLTQAAAQLRCGDPWDESIDLGPVIDEEAAQRIVEVVEDAVARGARLLQGGRRQGALVEPTVLDRVPPDAELVQTETFGPVAPILTFRTLEEAIEIANGTPYGLQAGVITDRSSEFATLARELRVGAVNLMDGPGFDSPHIPFGGVKKSGLGREGVRYAIREMSTVKTVVLPW